MHDASNIQSAVRHVHTIYVVGLVLQLSVDCVFLFVIIVHVVMATLSHRPHGLITLPHHMDHMDSSHCHFELPHGHLELPQNGDTAMYALLESKGAHLSTRDGEGLALLHEAVQVPSGHLSPLVAPTLCMQCSVQHVTAEL